MEAGLEYVGFEEINALELQEKAERVAEAQRAALVYQTNASLPGVPEGYVAPQQRKYEDETNDFDTALEEAAEKEENAPVVAPVVEESPVEAPAKEEAPVVEEKPAEEAPVVEEVKVKTTTTIEDLEKSLESSKGASKKTQSKKKNQKKAEEEQEEVVVHNDTPRMSIYTEEELAEMEEEDLDDANLDEDEDIDYDEYDQYYDEN